MAPLQRLLRARDWFSARGHAAYSPLALISALAIGYLLVETYRWRADSILMKNLALGLGGLMLLQIMVGAANIWTQMHDFFAALHVALATLIWGVLVVTVAVDNLLPRPAELAATSFLHGRSETAAHNELGD